MKVRDSGMPSEIQWSEFFDSQTLLSEMNIDAEIADLVEIGCGYGTFTIPAAKLISGRLYAYDIDDEMIENTNSKISQQNISNIFIETRDVLVHTTGLNADTIDYVMLFNILHHETPIEFINEVFRILKPQGKIGIIHWRSDIATPRGPDLSIRPKPEEILQWFDIKKFAVYKPPFNIGSYHFGIIITKK